jgi:hypothetical protein
VNSTTPPAAPLTPTSPADAAIRRFSTAALATVWAIAAAASFSHVRQLAQAHGQSGWVAWAIAVSLELVVGMAALEILRDSRAGHPSIAPWLVLLAGAGLVLATNLATAPPTAWGWILAGWPATASMAATKLFVRRLGHAAEDQDRRHATSQPVDLASLAAAVPALGRSGMPGSDEERQPGALSPCREGQLDHARDDSEEARPGSARRRRCAGADDPAELAARREHARRLYLDSASRGTPMTGKQLAAACNMSPRWARARIAEARQAQSGRPANPADLTAA